MKSQRLWRWMRIPTWRIMDALVIGQLGSVVDFVISPGWLLDQLGHWTSFTWSLGRVGHLADLGAWPTCHLATWSPIEQLDNLGKLDDLATWALGRLSYLLNSASWRHHQFDNLDDLALTGGSGLAKSVDILTPLLVKSTNVPTFLRLTKSADMPTSLGITKSACLPSSRLSLLV